MKCLYLIISTAMLCSALAAQEYYEDNGLKLPLITPNELQRHIGFFVLKYKDKNIDLSKSPIAAADITTLAGITGMHRVVWEGHDSLHSFQCFVKSGDRLFRYCFDFTVSPQARWDAYKSFEELFSGRSLTQYYICRIEHRTTHPSVDDILIQSNTDPVADKEKQDGAEKLFNSPQAKVR